MTPQELKNSILQLAIQGKLVEQRPEEGTAEELFARIQEEKQRLIKEGKIKKEKPLPEITEDEKSFEIPESWKWVKFGTCISLLSGSDLTPSKYNNQIKGIPYITGASNIEKGNIIFNRWTEFPNNIAAQGCLLLTCKGTVGKTAILTEPYVHIARQIMALTPIIVDVKYLQLFVECQVELLKKKAKSMIPGIERNVVLNISFPLPPFVEQKRIVAKIEELLPYIDRYEQAWSKLEQFNSRFPEDMKKSLLQYAIQGKLVEQRPEEGTAEELFAQIQEEKQRLIAEKKIKKEKPLPEITDDEKPFDIPESWKWVKLGSILHYIDTGKSFKCDEVPPTGNKCGIIKVSAVTWGKFNENESKSCYSSDSWVDEYAIHENDFLICRANTAALVGGCVIVDKISKQLMLSDKVLRLHFSKMIYPFYVLWALRTPLVRNQFSSVATGTSESMKNISQEILKNIIIPLPPLAEQKRIVEQLEQLLPLCERLK